MANTEQYDQVVVVGVDIQNDFCPGGSLAVTEGDNVVEPMNKALDYVNQIGGIALLTRDWHPAKTTHFIEYGGPWPPHCVQGTFGAEFRAGLNVDNAVILSKGMGEDEDAYSGFQARTPGGITLTEEIRDDSAEKVAMVIGGLATDYCVKETVLDALKEGFDTYLLTDAIAAVNLEENDGEKAIVEMLEAGAQLTTVGELVTGQVLELRTA